MARRGFFAELQRQSRIAQRERERQEREAAREHAALVRHREQAEKAAERARVQLSKAQAAEHKRLEKEAKEAHIAAREAEVQERNQSLAEVYGEIDSLLESTLSRDDYVDLNTLRVQAQHPPFGHPNLETPIALPAPIPDPPKPVLQVPEPPRGLARFFGKKKHAQAVETAHEEHRLAVSGWQAECRRTALRRESTVENHARAEQERIERLNREQMRYAEECRTREEQVAARNRSLNDLITNLGYGTVDAVQEYISIVLSNSVYPDSFPVNHEFSFNPTSAELELRVNIPEPGQIPKVKMYRYAKTADEIVSTPLSQKECRERYSSAVHQVALRSFHEVFEADRRGLIQTISLEVGTHAVDPATGLHSFIPLIIAAAERKVFVSFNLSSVVPALTLNRLGAVVSKNPFSLVPAERAGVRRA